MRKNILYKLRPFFLLLIALTLIMPTESKALAPKAQVVVTMSLYGTVGGAMLGLASLAYGTNFRAVAMGASLGLYAGLLFGGYLIGSHYFYKESRSGPVYTNPEEGENGASPYNGSEDTLGSDSGAVFRHTPIGKGLVRVGSAQYQTPLLYVPIIHISF